MKNPAAPDRVSAARQLFRDFPDTIGIGAFFALVAVVTVVASVVQIGDILARDRIVAEIESTHGVDLSESAVDKLDVPSSAPDADTTYGSDNLLLDGELRTVTLTFSNGAFVLFDNASGEPLDAD